MLHLFNFHQCAISEEMLFRLGEGIGFIYWHLQGEFPFLGGRNNTARSGEDQCLEVAATQRCGVSASRKLTSSQSKVEREMMNYLNRREPLMLQVDMGLLPYFPFYNQNHFGYHCVAAAGYDPDSDEVTLADREAQPHPVARAQLMAARSSTFKPFPPQNARLEYDFCNFHQPHAEEIRSAIQRCTLEMLHPPIRNMGIRGIQTAAQRIPAWPAAMDDHALAAACANTALYIRADAGTGGGLFRWMYARFLLEAAPILKDTALEQASYDLRAAGDDWE